MASVIEFDYSTWNKIEKYDYFLSSWQEIWDTSIPKESNLCNIYAHLRKIFGWWWIGTYWVRNEELILGVFQGDVACTRIGLGKGVCGSAWKERKTLIVPDVHQFPGHIACSSQSNSEIVVPVFGENDIIVGVLDVDSVRFNDFEETDRVYLEEFCSKLSPLLI